MISVTNFKILRTKFELQIFQDFQEILLKICPDSRSIDLLICSWKNKSIFKIFDFLLWNTVHETSFTPPPPPPPPPPTKN
jgi:hypothetical protein